MLESGIRETRSEDGFITTGFLSIVPSPDDDRKTLTCTAGNPHIPDFSITDHFAMNVSRKHSYYAKITIVQTSRKDALYSYLIS